MGKKQPIKGIGIGKKRGQTLVAACLTPSVYNDF
jgi:hypothetical protein